MCSIVVVEYFTFSLPIFSFSAYCGYGVKMYCDWATNMSWDQVFFLNPYRNVFPCSCNPFAPLFGHSKIQIVCYLFETQIVSRWLTSMKTVLVSIVFEFSSKQEQCECVSIYIFILIPTFVAHSLRNSGMQERSFCVCAILANTHSSIKQRVNAPIISCVIGVSHKCVWTFHIQNDFYCSEIRIHNIPNTQARPQPHT